LLRINQDNLIQGTLLFPDADLPLMFDYKAKFYDCGNDAYPEGYWVITVQLTLDFAFLPEDRYKVGDRLLGTNGIHKYILEDCYEPCA